MPYKDPKKRAESVRRHYANHRQDCIDRAAAAKNANKLVAREKIRVLKQSPCADCGYSYPYYVMQFDHVRAGKTDNVSAMVGRGMPWGRIESELALCDLVCANCHAERTHQRRQDTE